MRKQVLAIACLIPAALASAPAWTESTLAIKSASVDLPAGDALFPGGAEADAINNNCLACHSTEMVLTQPAFPKPVWEAEVRKMINVYKAPIVEADVAAIVAYLAKTTAATDEQDRIH